MSKSLRTPSRAHYLQDTDVGAALIMVEELYSNFNSSPPTQEQRMPPNLTPVVMSPRAIPRVFYREPGRSSLRFYCSMAPSQGRDKAHPTSSACRPPKRT